MISPITVTMPVVAKVSQATRASGSCARMASSTASLIWSQSLSGCPSVTDSEVKSLRMGSPFMEQGRGRMGGKRKRPDSVRPGGNSHRGKLLICQPIRFCARCGIWHLAETAGCRGFIGPIPPPLAIRYSVRGTSYTETWMMSSGKPYGEGMASDMIRRSSGGSSRIPAS